MIKNDIERALTPYEVERNKLIPQAIKIADGIVDRNNPLWSRTFFATMDMLWKDRIIIAMREEE